MNEDERSAHSLLYPLTHSDERTKTTDPASPRTHDTIAKCELGTDFGDGTSMEGGGRETGNGAMDERSIQWKKLQQ